MSAWQIAGMNRVFCITLSVTRCLCDARGQNASHCKIHDREKSLSYKISLSTFRITFMQWLRDSAKGLIDTAVRMGDFSSQQYLQYSGHVCVVLPGSVRWTVALWSILPRGHALIQLVQVWKQAKLRMTEVMSVLMHSPLASSKEVILWLGENPCRAPISEALPPERAPRGRAPVGVRPLSCRTCSDSSLILRGYVKINVIGLRQQNTNLRTENTLAIFPIARILFLMTSFLTWAWPEK